MESLKKRKLSEDSQRVIKGLQYDLCYTIYVAKIPKEITKEKFQLLFQEFSSASCTKIHYKRKFETLWTFINFTNLTEAIQAFKKLELVTIYGKSLQVSWKRK